MEMPMKIYGIVIYTLLIALLSKNNSISTQEASPEIAQEVSIKLNKLLDKTENTENIEPKIEQLSLLIGILPNSSESLKNAVKIIKNCLQRTSQFDVIIKVLDQPRKKTDIQELFDEGFTWVIFLKENDSSNNNDSINTLEWRIYDPIDAIMIKGKKVAKNNNVLKEWAYTIADQLWLELMQMPNCFASKIAYIKRKKDSKGKPCSIICLCDYDGSHYYELLNNSGIYVNTYWHTSSTVPRLFCSEFTRYNVRLISLSMQKHKKVVLNVDGTCVGISLAKKSNQAVYCRSGDIWHYGYNTRYKKGVHTRIIKNKGKNTNPILLENNDVIFCSDDPNMQHRKYAHNGPKICYYHKNTKKTEILTPLGYCVSPAYCAYTNKLVYSKKTKGLMQLFIYDMATQKHEQLTYNTGNKVDACWSSCGSYIVFCYNMSSEVGSRIAILHVATGKIWFITNKGDDCCYPSWSPKLDSFA